MRRKRCLTRLILMCVFIVAGCGDYSGRDRSSLGGLHYSDLIDRRGEPRQVLKDGSGGRIMSWSDIPVDEGSLSEPGSLGDDVYRVNSQGFVYDLP